MSPAALPVLVDLMEDLDPDVSRAAACALGRLGRPEARAALLGLLRDAPSAEVIDAITPSLGRPEARAALLGLLRDAPSAEVIDAITPIADEECVILLGRIARTVPDLADAAREAREALEARAALLGLLRDAPSAEVIDAITPIADEECVILLERIARTVPDLADAAREALEAIDHPRAAQVLTSISPGHGE